MKKIEYNKRNPERGRSQGRKDGGEKRGRGEGGRRSKGERKRVKGRRFKYVLSYKISRGRC